MLAQRWPSALATCAFLFACLTNAHAHVHLCLDGQELPASVHVVDASNHMQEHLGNNQGHDDLDLDVPNEALAKTLKYDLPAIVATATWTLTLAESTSSEPVLGRTPPPRPPPYFTLPPPRAPPR
jgi:hypothetical protein